jgi:CRISPR-associated endoribonuclease Cas6
VFQTPFRAWNAFAPKRLLIPSDWRDWCEDDVFVVGHQIQTAAVTISPREPPFAGFVGEVWFEARSDALLYLSLFQGLAQLAAFSGVGHKTTMGMGAVEYIGNGEG